MDLCFHVDSGNTCDDVTHRRSRDLLAQLVGHPDFLYVADCKLASRDNLHHIAARGGRFVTILPRTRGEDAAFRQRLRDAASSVTWQPCWTRREVPDEPGQADDDPPLEFHDELSPAQERLLRVLEIDPAAYGR